MDIINKISKYQFECGEKAKTNRNKARLETCKSALVPPVELHVDNNKGKGREAPNIGDTIP